LHRTLGGPQSRSGRGDKEKNSQPSVRLVELHKNVVVHYCSAQQALETTVQNIVILVIYKICGHGFNTNTYV